MILRRFQKHWAVHPSPTLHLKAHWLQQRNQSDAFEEYLHRFAAQHRRKGISTFFLLTDSAAPRFILGDYTLSAAQVDVASLIKHEGHGSDETP